MADQMANRSGVPIYTSKIIYSALDHVKERVIDLLPKVIEKRVSGEANVIQTFDIQGKGKSVIKVAGCRVSNGVIEKDKCVRVIRNGQTIHEGEFVPGELESVLNVLQAPFQLFVFSSVT